MDVAYVVTQLATLLLFTVFISDKRKRPGMAPLIDPRATRVLKASYLFPIAAYGYSLILLRKVGPVDWIALFCAAVATFLVVRGKLDLGRHHTWTGYHLEGGHRTRNGIYAILPHPMYTGIVLMISSCSLVYVSRLPWCLSVAALAACAYVVAFLVVAAKRESRALNGTVSADQCL